VEEHLHHLIAEMIDDFRGNTTERWSIESAGGAAVEGGPGFALNLGFEVRLERTVGVVRAKEVGVPDKKLFSL
jgi:hypothetical protein